MFMIRIHLVRSYGQHIIWTSRSYRIFPSVVKRPEDLKWQEHPLRILDIPFCPDFLHLHILLDLLLQIVAATGNINIRFNSGKELINSESPWPSMEYIYVSILSTILISKHDARCLVYFPFPSIWSPELLLARPMFYCSHEVYRKLL